jgi:hypothetical protein
MRHLTDAERERWMDGTQKQATTVQEAVSAGDARCDSCEAPAVAIGHSGTGLPCEGGMWAVLHGASECRARRTPEPRSLDGARGRVTADEYRTLRERIGTQADVAERLGVHAMTVSRRERGVLPVTDEAAIALRCLVEHAA